MSHRLRACSRVIVAATFLHTSIAVADHVPAGFDFQVNTYTSGDQYAGAESVARDAGGRFVVVWTAHDADGLGVFGQRFDTDGSKLGTEFQVNAYTTGLQGGDRLAVSSAPAGEFTVVWTSVSQDGDARGVFARSFDANGVPAGTEFQVNEYTTRSQNSASVAHDASGNFFVTWESNGANLYRADISARLFDVAGAPLGTEFQIANQPNVSEILPRVASSKTGEFVVVWSAGYAFDPAEIKARVFDSSAVPTSAEIVVNADSSLRPSLQDVGMDAAGNFIVSWSQDSGFSRESYIRRFDAAGLPYAAEALFYAPSKFSMSSDGRFIAAWAAINGIVARQFDAFGVPEGSEFVVNDYLSGFNTAESIAVGDEGSFVVAWTNAQHFPFGDATHTRDGSGSGVFARRFCDMSDAGCDICPGYDDAVDDDADGIPNGCDPCMAGFTGQALLDSKLDIRYRVQGVHGDIRAGEAAALPGPAAAVRAAPGTPLPSNRVRLSGEFDLDSTGIPFASLDPSVRGVRIRVENNEGHGVVDQRLEGGTYAGPGTRGWTNERNGKVWRFRDRTDTPSNGFRTVILENRSALEPGIVRVVVRSSAGVYDADPSDSPLRGIVVLGDQADADSGTCAVASYTAEQCRTGAFNYLGNDARCRN